jgi:hypothetical protein
MIEKCVTTTGSFLTPEVFWLRSIQALKDPFADALGGIPPGRGRGLGEKTEGVVGMKIMGKSWENNGKIMGKWK